jgi:putative transposase
VSKSCSNINADVNGAFQIMKKVAPNAYANGVEGVVIHPIKVNII